MQHQGMSEIKKYVKAQSPRPMREIAEGLGISRPFLYDLIEGKREPSLEVAQRISEKSAGAVPITAWPRLASVIAAVKGSAA